MSTAIESLFQSNDLTTRLQQRLISCSETIASGDFRLSDESISELVGFLNSFSDAVVASDTDDDNSYSEDDAFQILTETHRFLASPSLEQDVIDRLAFELPKAVARFASVSQRCYDIVEDVINLFTQTCSPRDMLSILCEALDSPGKMITVPSYFAPLLNGISRVFVSIQRRQFEQIKEAIPVVLNVLKSTCAQLDEDTEDVKDVKDLLNKSICISNSIVAVCEKLSGGKENVLRDLLRLFVLQIMALVSISVRDNVSSHLPLVLQLSQLLKYCNLSYFGLITGESDAISRNVFEELGDEYMGCFSHTNLGASLAVIWGHQFNEVAQSMNEDLAILKKELSNNQAKRWQMLGMLRHIFSCVHLTWIFKEYTMNFLLWIFDGNITYQYSDANIECSFQMPNLFAFLQAVKIILIFAPNRELRKNAFTAMKKVLADFPASLRFDIFMALIRNSKSSSMIAILLDCLKEEMHGNHSSGEKAKGPQNNAFWNSGVLEAVEFVLRPPHGGPPPLPENVDSVLAALNMYRFILLSELTSNTNYTGVLSRDKLQKAYNEWLLPLRVIVTGCMKENREDSDNKLAMEVLCSLNPVEFVLYRCIELVEERMKCADAAT
ncbi:aberrant root formation protein 4 [Impatiens glandulifera]|uniref:aberrant root formation protein 4 n=1 Tax=Impatiens glandulifera TaxID=253017 RepID=UPI001FB05EE9|nr:aberrant root formation protein 4 [Impatiens glandulifera]